MSPFRVLYGRDAPTFLKFEDNPSSVEAINEQLKLRDSIIAELKLHLGKAQQRMRDQANKARREVTFEVGERVFLKIKPYKLRSLA